jgi:hypothetical protein
MEAGLGPKGGGWNIRQASEWSGLGTGYLRGLVKRKLAGEAVSVFPFHQVGRRILIPREGFRNWFNALDQSAA